MVHYLSVKRAGNLTRLMKVKDMIVSQALEKARLADQAMEKLAQTQVS